MSGPFRRLTNLYARAVDRGDLDGLCSIFIEEGRIHGPGFDFRGREDFSEMFASLSKNFEKTQHRFFNQLIDIDGDSARGETYAMACHLVKVDDNSWESHDWAIRYQDEFEKQNGNWIFKSRELIVDWTQTNSAAPLT